MGTVHGQHLALRRQLERPCSLTQRLRVGGQEGERRAAVWTLRGTKSGAGRGVQLAWGWGQGQWPWGNRKSLSHVGYPWFMETQGGGGCERHWRRFAPGLGPRLTHVAANCYRRFAFAVQLSLCGIKENIKIF